MQKQRWMCSLRTKFLSIWQKEEKGLNRDDTANEQPTRNATLHSPKSVCHASLTNNQGNSQKVKMNECQGYHISYQDQFLKFLFCVFLNVFPIYMLD